MPYSRVTRTAYGRDAIQYALEGHGHNGAERRNEIVTPIYMNPRRSYEEQFEEKWRFAKRNHTTQIIRVIQSFSKNEFNPDDPCDIQKANELGQELVDTYYPDRQALVCTQTDGIGGCVHNHILISDVSLTDYKGCTKEQYHYRTIRRWSDEIVARYTIPDYGEKSNDIRTRYEEKLEEQELFSYRKEIKKRVAETMKFSVSEEDFLRKLTANGIDAVKKTNKNHGDYFTYELVDISEIPEGTKLPNRALKARSYKLGTAYGPEALQECIERNKKSGVNKEFVSTDNANEAESLPKMSFTSKEETERQEEVFTASKTAAIKENEVENLVTVIIDTEEKEEETAVPTKENHAQISDSIAPKTAKPVCRKKQSEKDAPDLKRRKAQLEVVVYNSTISENGKDDRQCD